MAGHKTGQKSGKKSGKKSGQQAGQGAIYPSLAGKAVLVTGGASGIGAAIVRAFVAQGARVGFLDINAEAGHHFADSLQPPPGGEVRFAACDLRHIEALRRAVGGMQAALGPVSILVNNAGQDDRHESEYVEPEYWTEQMAANLDHMFFVAQAVVGNMVAAGGGSIVCLSSIGPIVRTPNQVVYLTAKAGIIGLVRSLAGQYGPDNVRVNAVLPGSILTDRQKRLWLTPEYEREVLSRQCLKRHVMPEEVAKLVLFLASDEAGAITAQSHVVDAGWT